MSSPLSYLSRHSQAFFGALGRVLRRPLGSVLAIGVIGIALALPTGLWVLVKNAQSLAGKVADTVNLEIYLKTDVPLARARELADSLKARSDGGRVELISAEQALEEFRRSSNFAAALETLEGNPLPHVIVFSPVLEQAEPAALQALRTEIEAWPETETAQLDLEWATRLKALLELLRSALWALGGLFALGVIAIIGNTVRLEIAARRAEIEVTKLVGGSNAFIRRPFLYTGALYGFFGGLFAVVFLLGLGEVLGSPLQALERAYGTRFALLGLSATDLGGLLGGGALLGLLGAWLGAARHLARIEPRR
jgi:cell division transport system permease protein